MNPEQQFKNFLIFIVVVVAIILFLMIRPSALQNFSQKGAFRLSSQKPWHEDIFSDKNENEDDVKIQIELTENQFENNNAEKDFEFSFMPEYDDAYWVTGSVPINPMTDLNFKSRLDILKARKKYVENSIFKNKNYLPTEAVFGQISDNKPWLGINALTCYGKGPKSNLGLSEESRFINNPTVLIGLDRNDFDEKPKSLCSPVDYLMPVKIHYSKDNNTIKVVFEVSEYKGSLGSTFTLKGLNARDLGFKYGYAYELTNLIFVNTPNISTGIYEFKDFIQLGTSCGVAGGCNNGAPVQKDLTYTVMTYPAKISLKLWRKMPKSVDAKADINYLIILR